MDPTVSTKSNLYEVMGVRPDASDDEIRKAAKWLIDENGFRVGVPLRRHWARARDIKAAYEVLGDPEKRRSYDETLGQPANDQLWPATAGDAGTDELVRSAEGERLDTDDRPSIGPRNAAPLGAVAATGLLASGGLPASTARMAPASAAGSETAYVDESQAASTEKGALQDFPYGAARHVTIDGGRRMPARGWVMSGVAMAGLGLVLLASWPGGEAGPTGTSSRQAASGAMGSLAALGNAGESTAPLVADGVDGTEGDAEALAETASLPDVGQAGFGAAVDPDSGAGAEDAVTEASGEHSTTRGPVQVAAVSQPVRTAEPSAQPMPATSQAVAAAKAAPAAGIVQANLRSSSATQSLPVSRPARWIGGGPTDKDNRRGRYRGAVAVSFTVGAGGQVSNCTANGGSADPSLAALTCRLITERARFTPAADQQGRSVPTQIDATYVWGRGRRPRS